MTKSVLTPPLPKYHSPLIFQPEPPLPYVPLNLSVSFLRWTLPLAVVLPGERGSLWALPACRQAALASHETVFLLSALAADLALGQLILQWRNPAQPQDEEGRLWQQTQVAAEHQWPGIKTDFSQGISLTKRPSFFQVSSLSPWPKDGDTWAS